MADPNHIDPNPTPAAASAAVKAEETGRSASSERAGAERNRDTTETKTDAADRAASDARSADARALEARAKAADADKSEAHREADKAALDADDKRAEAHRANVEATAAEPMTAEEAKVVLPNGVPQDIPAGSHYAQKFGNDPANPKPADGLHLYEDGEDGKQELREDVDGVLLSRITPDSPTPVYAHCHPEMVGDYIRAGWSRA